jgi:exopolysaccharide biosynthesis polyprenyl glycosylphosphotransferase
VLSRPGSARIDPPQFAAVETPGSRYGSAAYRRANRRGSLVRRALAVADLAGLTAAFLLSALAYGSRASATNGFSLDSELILFFATLPAWLLLAKLHGLYDRDEEHAGHTTVDDLIGIVKVVTIGAWLLFVASWLTRIANPYPSKLIVFWAVAVIFVVLARVAARAWCRRRPAFVQNALLLGSGDAARLLTRKFRVRKDYGVNLVGFIDGHADEASKGAIGRLGSIDQLPELVDRHNIERVIVEFPDLPREQIAAIVRDLRRHDVQVDIVPRLYELIAPSADVHTVEGLPMIGLPPERAERSLRVVKRGVDIVGSAIGLLLLAPVLGWTALRIKLDTPGPVFYRHPRVGEGGRAFSVVKFRTMYIEDCVGEGYGGKEAASEFLRMLEDPVRKLEFDRIQKIVDDPRVTPFGRFIRRMSLDELPQLVNVLLGHMSLVGPRPVTRAELARYEPDADTLLTFRPGVTGYWQVNGRSDTSWDDRVRLDLSYVHGWSLKLDFLILGKTFWVLLTGRGAY